MSYVNVSEGGAPQFELDPDFEVDLPPVSTPVMADFNGDGRMDVIAGGTAGGVRILLGR